MSGSGAKEPHSGHVIAGRWELGSIIGRGGHGLVWKAKDRDTGRLVALKMLTDVASKDPQQVERLRREQLALVKLAGTSAVELIDLCRTSNGKLCLVMELLDGVDLEAHLEALEQRGQRISVGALLSVLEPVMSTLERAHEQGIIHRDLKPANIFMLAERAGGGVRVLDFGLARLRSQMPLTAAGTVVGSPSYIAPEAWKGRSEDLDQRVDVYSFGVLVFRALSAEFPFPGSSLQEKFRAATTAPRPPLSPLRPDLPREIDDWVAQVLAIDAELRFRTLRGAWNALLAALGNPALASALVTAEDLASAASASAPLEPPPPPPAPAPAPRIPTPVMPTPAPREPSSGRLPALKAVFLRAASAVAQLADAVTGAERKRTPVPMSPPPPTPPTADTMPSPVSVSPVMAVGSRAREGKSMVREWLAGSELEVEKREPSDVVAWLGGEPAAPVREQTLPMAARVPGEPAPAAREATLPMAARVPEEPAPAETPRKRKKATTKKATTKKATAKSTRARAGAPRKAAPAKKKAPTKRNRKTKKP